MTDFKMDDYVDVAERIRDFRAAHPEGALQQVDVKFIDFAGKSWVIFTAAAYRSPDDPRPGMGTAWEPVPGRTPFTRDSELQNAETAAWGRAIVAALAGDTKRGVATAQDVRNRVADRDEAERFAAAQAEVQAAWVAHRGEWDFDAMRHDYESSTRKSLDDAMTEDLKRYAKSLARKRAERLPDAKAPDEWTTASPPAPGEE